ncbi:MAG: ribonuclease J [Myxococcaceae bacterium]
MLELVPLGGLGEIGLNAMAVDAGNDAFLIDAGLMFPTAQMPGVEVVMPDFTHLLARRNTVRGVVLTHGHEDHVGALPTLLREINVPVFGTPYTLGVASRRLEEAGVRARLIPMAPGEIFALGDTLSVEPFHVCHSTPGAVGLIVRTPEGTVVHTGDFKLDEHPWDGQATDLDRVRAAADEGVLCLLSDSTNAEVEGHTPSERSVAEAFSRLLPETPGRIVITLFASNIPRVAHILRLAERLRRRVVLLGRSLQQAVALAAETRLLSAPPGLFASLEEAESLPKERVLLLTGGAQAEGRSSLVRLSRGELPAFALGPGDHVVVSGRTIPGNERTVTAMLDALVHSGARITYPALEPRIHVSGHAAREQQRQMLQAARPRHFVPIHGELRHLHHHRHLATESGLSPERVLLAQDGDVIRFDDGRGELAGAVPVGRRYQDRLGTWHVSEQALQERRMLSQSGIVVVSIVIDHASSGLLTGPRLTGRGLCAEEQALLPTVESDARATFAGLTPSERLNDALASDALLHAVRQSFRSRLGTRPTVLPHVVKL